MIPQAPRILFFRSSLLWLCWLSGLPAFQGGCAIVGSTTASNNSTAAGGSAQVCIGCTAIPPETITQLKAQGITEAALNQFFTVLGREKTPPDKLDHELRDIAKNYLDLKTKIAALLSEDPEGTAILQQARQAVEAVDFSLAERLFNEASQRDEQAAQHLQQAATTRLISAAAAQAANGDLHMVQLNFVKAQAYYRIALQLLPPSDRENRGQYLNSLGTSLREAGIRTEGADIQKFLREALTVRTKALLPQDWARTQNNLGNTLQNQGTRTGGENGKALIRQAINAFELALEVRTREVLSVQWEETMQNHKIAKKGA